MMSDMMSDMILLIDGWVNELFVYFCFVYFLYIIL